MLQILSNKTSTLDPEMVGAVRQQAIPKPLLTQIYVAKWHHQETMRSITQLLHM